MKRSMKQVISTLLALVLLVNSVPIQSFSLEPEGEESVSPSESTQAQTGSVSSDTDGVMIEGELTDARNKYEKHYKLTDGSFMVTTFEVPVHYESEGEWIDIDNSLSPVTMFDGSELYQAVNGERMIAFSESLADGSVMAMSQGDHVLSMSLWTEANETEDEIILESEEEPPLESEPEETEATVTEGTEPSVDETEPEETEPNVSETEAAAPESTETSENETEETEATEPEPETTVSPDDATESQPTVDPIDETQGDGTQDEPDEATEPENGTEPTDVGPEEENTAAPNETVVPTETTEPTEMVMTTEATDPTETVAPSEETDPTTPSTEVTEPTDGQEESDTDDAAPSEAEPSEPEDADPADTENEESELEGSLPEEATEESTEEEQEDEPVIDLTVFNSEVTAEIDNAVPSTDEETETVTLCTLDDVVPAALSSTVIYENVYPGIDLRYDTFSYNVKESIILNEPIAYAEGTDTTDLYEFSFLLEFSDLVPELQTNGSITLSDTAGTVLFTMPAPYMFDSADHFSGDVYYTLEQTDAGWKLTVHADNEWIEAEDRVYPITIDPSFISADNNSTFVGGVAMENGTVDDFYDSFSDRMAVGYHDGGPGQMEMYFKVTNLPALDAGFTIVSAAVGLKLIDYRPNASSSTVSTLFIHEVTEATSGTAWLSDLTWSNKPEYGDVLDYTKAHAGLIDTYLEWDITEAAKKWYGEDPQNNGLAVTSDQTSSTAYRAWFNYSGTAVFAMNYRSTAGLESYYTYETHSAARAGTAYVGDFSGDLTVVKDLVNYPNTAMSYGLSHVYNSTFGDGEINDHTNSLTSVAQLSPDYSKMKTGHGWQLSAQESILRTKIDGTTYLVYRDGDGTQHFFTYNSSEDQYEDEDGLGLSIYVPDSTSGTDTSYTLSDQNGNKKYFHNGYLMYSEDGNGNRVCYLYNGKSYSSTLSSWYPATSGNNLTSIVSVNKGQSAKTICTLAYSNSYLSSITDYAGFKTSFTYTGGKLTQIKHHDGSIVYYDYSDENGLLANMYDGDSTAGLEFKYLMDSVWTIGMYTAASYSAIETEMNLYDLIMIYRTGVHRTSYHHMGNSGSIYGSDVVVTDYVFDHAGRTINALTSNKDGTRVYAVTAAAYTDILDKSRQSNRMKKSGQAGEVGANLIAGGSAESHDGFTSPSSCWTKTNTASGNFNAVVKSGELARTGTSALKIWVAADAPTDSNGVRRLGLCQSVYLTQDVTYTFSGYINTKSVTSYGTDGGLYLAFMDSGKEIIVQSNKINFKTNQNIDGGWQQEYVTYSPKTSGYYYVAVMQENAYEYGYFDDLQLEEAEAPSAVNLAQNLSEASPTGWTYVSGDKSSMIVDTGSDGRDYILSMDGSYDLSVRMKQTVPINGPATDTYLLSGWGTAQSVANTETELTDSTAENNTSLRYFGVIASCNYSDGTKEYFYMPFNDDCPTWQFASCVIAPSPANQSKTITSITIILAYDCNMNTVSFDDIVLVQEPCATYTYDFQS